MPRQARLDLPGFLYHVIARGLDRRPIFLDSEDRSDFISRIQASFERVPIKILAWALMPNHFHLLIRTGDRGLAPFMRSLTSGYAIAFNRRHDRNGYLFQNRFKSILCEEGPYFLELVRYIHLNPVRAGLVKSVDALADYPWSGHRALMGGKAPPWQDVNEVLRQFSSQKNRAPSAYASFLEEGLKEKPRDDLMGGGLRRSMGGWIDRRARQAYDSQVLGTGGFVEEVLRRAENRDKDRRVWKGMTIEALSKPIAAYFGLTSEALFKRGRQKPLSQAKAVLIYAGVDKLGETQKRLADLMCMTPAAAGRARYRGQVLWEKIQPPLELVY